MNTIPGISLMMNSRHVNVSDSNKIHENSNPLKFELGIDKFLHFYPNSSSNLF